MTEPDRQDGDELLADQQFENMVLAAIHTTLPTAAIGALTVMVSDIQRLPISTILFAKEILANATPQPRDAAEDGYCHNEGATFCPVCGLAKLGRVVPDKVAPPKPAPDAMREALQQIANLSLTSQAIPEVRRIVTEALSVPLPSTAHAEQVLYAILSKYIPQESIDGVWQQIKEARIFFLGQGRDDMNYNQALERAKTTPVMRPHWKLRWLTFENGRHLELHDDGSAHEWCPLHHDMVATD